MANKRIRKKRWKKAGGTLKCVLCGKELWQGVHKYFAGRHGVVCHKCLHAGYVVTLCQQAEEIKAREADTQPAIVPTPQKLMERLDRMIAGQEEAKRAIALAMWKQHLRAAGEDSVPSSHLLLYGPSGCGKTFLAQRAADLAGLPSVVFDATTLSEAGYRGRDAVDILKDYDTATEGRARRGYGVVILDEVDKIAAKGGSDRQAYCRGTQHSLLKLLEGITYEGLDSSKLLFVLCGAFHGLYDRPEAAPIGFLRERNVSAKAIGPENFVEFGMERELMGRVAGLAPIRPLTEEDLVDILLDKEGSALKVYQAFFERRGVTLTLSHDGAKEIARRALTLGTGARALNAELDKVMEPLMFRLAEGELSGEVEADVHGLLQVQGAVG